MSNNKKMLGMNVYEAAVYRTEWVFDTFPNIYLSFSGGKDSAVMLHIAADAARKYGRKFSLLFVDLEAQYKMTIDFIEEMYVLYSDIIYPFWICLPINLRNAVSVFEPQWQCWQPGAEWVRDMPKIAIRDAEKFDFFYQGMEFEEFVPKFGKWYSDDLTACMVGIRTGESLNRWRTIKGGKKQMLEDRPYTTWCGQNLYNVYPIYDWTTADIWIYNARFNKPYNPLYDRMHAAGLTTHQMRICQPYGDDQRKGLWLFHIIEPETWKAILNRVSGANQGSLYARESGNVQGNRTITLPDAHSWKSYAMMLLETMPTRTSEHYKNKIAVFLRWYETRGYPSGIPDDGPLDKKSPSWKRICKALLRNDYWCKGLSFTQHKSDAYEKYRKIMAKRRQEWKLMI